MAEKKAKTAEKAGALVKHGCPQCGSRVESSTIRDSASAVFLVIARRAADISSVRGNGEADGQDSPQGQRQEEGLQHLRRRRAVRCRGKTRTFPRTRPVVERSSVSTAIYSACGSKAQGRILNRERINKTIEGVYFICIDCKKVCHNMDDGLVEEPREREQSLRSLRQGKRYPGARRWQRAGGRVVSETSGSARPLVSGLTMPRVGSPIFRASDNVRVGRTIRRSLLKSSIVSMSKLRPGRSTVVQVTFASAAAAT